MTATYAQFTDGGLPLDVADTIARIRAAPDVVHVAAMPDLHLAEDVCVGLVVATTRRLYPAAVGGDIGCGMMAARFDMAADAVDNRTAARILRGLYERIPRDRHRAGACASWPASLDDAVLSAPPLSSLARHEGRAQLGTLGSGNHFVELQRDEDGRLWVMLHSGSRAMGPAIRDYHQRVVGAAGLVSIDAESDAGHAYLADLTWAIQFAEENRRILLAAVNEVVGDVLQAAIVQGSTIACHHNHVRREDHSERALWVHRKGAIQAGVGELGIIPGSMGSASFHVEGRGHPESLASAAHGAGRRMSRTEARRHISARALTRQLAGVFWDHRRAGVLRDEAPAAYKDVSRVMRAQHDLVRIVRRLMPVLAFKGS